MIAPKLTTKAGLLILIIIGTSSSALSNNRRQRNKRSQKVIVGVLTAIAACKIGSDVIMLTSPQATDLDAHNSTRSLQSDNPFTSMLTNSKLTTLAEQRLALRAKLEETLNKRKLARAAQAQETGDRSSNIIPKDTQIRSRVRQPKLL